VRTYRRVGIAQRSHQCALIEGCAPRDREESDNASEAAWHRECGEQPSRAHQASLCTDSMRSETKEPLTERPRMAATSAVVNSIAQRNRQQLASARQDLPNDSEISERATGESDRSCRLEAWESAIGAYCRSAAQVRSFQRMAERRRRTARPRQPAGRGRRDRARSFSTSSTSVTRPRYAVSLLSVSQHAAGATRRE
jgi:hypothetical protein